MLQRFLTGLIIVMILATAIIIGWADRTRQQVNSVDQIAEVKPLPTANKTSEAIFSARATLQPALVNYEAREAGDQPAYVWLDRLVPDPPPLILALPTAPNLPPSGSELAEHVASGGRWLDVELTTQTVFAMEGETVKRAFIVSTGTEYTPTVEGNFRVYLKYDQQDMSGPGYNVPGVPNVLYFHQGYGFHGTYWHSNFGTPMSHGCVNMSLADSAWLYEFAELGTPVRVHQ